MKQIITDEFISRLETMALYVNSTLKGYFGGNHRTKTYGSTVEFADFREYNLGDDIRRIDWNLLARFEKHFIKLFVDERQMHIQIFVDCSASMKKIHESKAEYALRAAAALGFLAVNNMDKTTFHFINGVNAENPFGMIAGKTRFFAAAGGFEGVQFKGTADLEKAIVTCPATGTKDGVTVIISDFLTENNWKQAVDYLHFKKRQIILLQVLAPEEINPAYNGRMVLFDSESSDVLDDRNMKMRITKAHLKAYRQALDDYMADIRSFCADREAIFYSVNSEESVEKLIFGKFHEAGVVK
jgi:uncharacterized protein (DUF58 family)